MSIQEREEHEEEMLDILLRKKDFQDLVYELSLQCDLE